MSRLRRSEGGPRWSGAITRPLATRIAPPWRRPALVFIKGVHTIAFFSISALIGVVVWDGVRSDPRRRTVGAALVALGEAAVYGTNNFVCPLTPLAEELGAARGTVTDLYLPTWLSTRIPLLGGAGLILGLVLNLRAARRG